MTATKTYTPPKVDFAKRRKSVAIPDQSLTIQEIVRRYVRGIPVDVIQRKAIYIDQQEFDLEKLSRMDFAEKAEYAGQLAAQAHRLQNELEEAMSAAQAKREAAKAAQDAAEAAAKAAKQQTPGTGQA